MDEESYRTPGREVGSRTITLNFTLTPESGVITEDQEQSLVRQLRNAMAQINMSPIPQFTEAERHMHYPPSVIQLTTPMEDPPDADLVKLMETIEKDSPQKSAQLGLEDLSTGSSFESVLLQSHRQFTEKFQNEIQKFNFG
jgi:hypothetical protein